MVIIEYNSKFKEFIEKIKDGLLKERIKKQIIKIIENPEIGKPMRYVRKDTREVYISPFGLSYAYVKENNKIIFLDIFHKDEQ